MKFQALDLNAKARRHQGSARQRGNRIARSVWSAWSLLPLSNHPPPHDRASKLDALPTLRVAVHPSGLSRLASLLEYDGAKTWRLCIKTAFRPGAGTAGPGCRRAGFFPFALAPAEPLSERGGNLARLRADIRSNALFHCEVQRGWR